MGEARQFLGFLSTLMRPVVIALFLEIMLGITGLAESKNETSCGGWEINVAYVN